VVAEIEAREVGMLDLGEALELTALVALRDRERGRRYDVRWLRRWLDVAEAPTIDEATMLASLEVRHRSKLTDAMQPRRGRQTWPSRTCRTPPHRYGA
jgi:hypothetical protein